MASIPAASSGSARKSFLCQAVSAMWITELVMNTNTAARRIGNHNVGIETMGTPLEGSSGL